MSYEIRPEAPRDYSPVELLTYRAFVNAQIPERDYCDEHLLAHNMRKSPAFVPELDYVAEMGAKLVGNIMYTLSKIVDANRQGHTVLTLGPVSVLPEHQKQGVGTALIEHTIGKARELGYKAILIYGHPEYFSRFGFKNAEYYCITSPDGENFDAFMALPLYDGALDGITGKHYHAEVFDELDREQLRAFNEQTMNRLEVFFDYACPYCLTGHNDLMKLIELDPAIQVIWRPCESHPRPDDYGPHSDLCIQGMFYVMEHGGDILEYHKRMYAAALKDRGNIENIGVLTDLVKDLVDAEGFRASLAGGEYVHVQQDANRYAFIHCGVWAVPAYRMNGSKLDSVEDVGVTRDELARFLSEAKREY